MPKVTAFIARSFDSDDERRIEPILDFLKSFRASGFLAESADRAEVESVSRKVRDMIDGSNVFVGIFTRRYAIYDSAKFERSFLRLFLPAPQPERWVAPSWVIQESGYALKAIPTKKLILFRETGVELPLLQADLEYIEFDVANFVPAFQKASEMINGLLSEASGEIVETVVRSTSPPAQEETEAAPVQANEPTTPPPGFGHFYIALREAIGAKDWEKANEAYTSGLAFVEQNDPKGTLFWKATFHQLRYSAGQTDGLDALKTLADENPNDPDPLTSIAVCFLHFQQYEKAAEYYLKAAKVARDGDALDCLVYAARALRDAKKLDDALQLIFDACRTSKLSAREQMGVRKELYALLKDTKNTYVALAIGEWILMENPGAGDVRFSVAYDYEDEDFDDLSLFHYRIMRANDPNNESVLNNMGVAYSKLNLSISAVDLYMEAWKRGNTLAADNLAKRYLAEGFSADARELISEAITQKDYDSRLPQTLSSLAESQKEEEAKEKNTLKVRKSTGISSAP